MQHHGSAVAGGEPVENVLSDDLQAELLPRIGGEAVDHDKSQAEFIDIDA